MAESILIENNLSKAEKYAQLIPQIKALIDFESDKIANLANIAAALKESFNFLWVGFYEFKIDELVLGPFQGPIACTRIRPNKGVCGTSYSKAETIIVPNVDEFPGHIACSTSSRSEIAIPIIKNGNVVAILDADSEQLDQFDQIDALALEELAQIISAKW